jgi:hypothetical protein
MFSKLKAAGRLAGTRGRRADAPAAPAVECKGLPHPAALPRQQRYQTARIIEKDTFGRQGHRFIAPIASKQGGRGDLGSKAKQIIDLQGDRMFLSPSG